MAHRSYAILIANSIYFKFGERRYISFSRAVGKLMPVVKVFDIHCYSY